MGVFAVEHRHLSRQAARAEAFHATNFNHFPLLPWDEISPSRRSFKADIFAGLSIGGIVGSSNAAVTGGNLHAFLFHHGRMLDLGTLPGQPSSEARGINRSGQVVGFTSSGQNTNFRAFLYSDGIMKDLNSLIQTNSGWFLWFALAINRRGQITGYGSNN